MDEEDELAAGFGDNDIIGEAAMDLELGDDDEDDQND